MRRSGQIHGGDGGGVGSGASPGDRQSRSQAHRWLWRHGVVDAGARGAVWGGGGWGRRVLVCSSEVGSSMPDPELDCSLAALGV